MTPARRVGRPDSGGPDAPPGEELLRLHRVELVADRLQHPGGHAGLVGRHPEDLRAVVAAADLPGPVTVTAGVASFPQHAVAIPDLIRSADAALYTGKGAGRDRVVIAGAPSVPHGG